MSAIAYALVLFGCSDDATFCERLSDKARVFQSRVQCEMEIASAFESDLVRRADYPTVIGECMDRGHWAKLDGKPVDLSQPNVRLAAKGGNTDG